MGIKYSSTKHSKGAINLLVYGRSGVGKTSLIPTCPAPIIVSSERGLLSIASHDIPVAEVSCEADLEELMQIVVTQKFQKQFKTVVVDSVSDVAETLLVDLKQGAKDPRQAYGQLQDFMAKFIRVFRDLPLNIVFIAKGEVYENAAGLQAMRPAMPGRRLTSDLPFYFDEVLALLVRPAEDGEKEERTLQCHPTAQLDAKDRSGLLKKYESANIGKLIKKLRGKK